MRRLVVALLLTASCHEPEGDQPIVTTEATPSASATSSAPLPVSASERHRAAADDDDHGGLKGIGEGGGIIRSSDAGFDRFAYGNDPRKPTGATIRVGDIKVTGRLPPEVVKRIVRQNYQKLRACYRDVVAKRPTQTSDMSTSFTIDTQGAVKGAKTTSDIDDKATLSCIERAFTALSFPQPEGGVVEVVYPLTFSPPEYKFMIGDKYSVQAREADVVKALEAAGYKVTGASSSPPPTFSRFKAEKSYRTFSITLDPEASLPLATYAKLSKEAAVLEDGSWGLFVESSDKASSQQLIDAIHEKVDPK